MAQPLSVSGPLYILQTWFAPDLHPVHVHRIECGWDMLTPLPQRLIFLTSDPDVFADALDCERMPVRVLVQWYREDRVQVAVRLQLAPAWMNERTDTK